VIKNVDSLMLLPHGASKATGIRWLMDMYCVGTGEMACIGDAENDIDMRGLCTLMGAVANALPAVKSESDYLCRDSFGAGLREFLEHIENLHVARAPL
jgi:hydroxymethylpyrimidine pyrophosphatase-like HAD family hydrolase